MLKLPVLIYNFKFWNVFKDNCAAYPPEIMIYGNRQGERKR